MLDEPKIIQWLRELRIRAVRAPTGMTDEELGGAVAARRILVTASAVRFRDLAIRNEIGVITLCPERLAGHPLRAALTVSVEIARRRLWSRPKPWILRARPYRASMEDLRES